MLFSLASIKWQKPWWPWRKKAPSLYAYPYPFYCNVLNQYFFPKHEILHCYGNVHLWCGKRGVRRQKSKLELSKDHRLSYLVAILNLLFCVVHCGSIKLYWQIYSSFDRHVNKCYGNESCVLGHSCFGQKYI